MLSGFLDAILSFPTVLFTVPLALVMLYWGAVFLGLLDFGEGDDVGLDGALEALDGVEGALDGAVDGVLDGVDLDPGVESGLESGLEGAEVDADGCFDGPLSVLKAPFGCLASVLGAFGLVGVPMTLVLSFLALFGFAFSLGGTRFLKWAGIGIAAAGGVTVLAGVGVLVGAVFLGLAFTSVAVKPMKPLFRIHAAKTRRHWVGHVATVRSGSVDTAFGQAEIDDGGAGLLLDVRCLEANTLRRGDPALIYDYDARGEVYLIKALPGGLDTLKKNLDGKETNPR
jgi:hypothetical protein